MNNYYYLLLKIVIAFKNEWNEYSLTSLTVIWHPMANITEIKSTQIKMSCASFICGSGITSKDSKIFSIVSFPYREPFSDVSSITRDATVVFTISISMLQYERERRQREDGDTVRNWNLFTFRAGDQSVSDWPFWFRQQKYFQDQIGNRRFWAGKVVSPVFGLHKLKPMMIKKSVSFSWNIIALWQILQGNYSD